MSAAISRMKMTALPASQREAPPAALFAELAAAPCWRAPRQQRQGQGGQEVAVTEEELAEALEMAQLLGSLSDAA